MTHTAKMISRCRQGWPLLLAAAGLLLAACSTNPATGQQSFTMFMSPQEELRVGQEEHPKIIKSMGGTYTEQGIADYVNAVGQQLARRSELPDLKYTFTVLDTDTVNAFALPGGYVYITRGLLALANTEAEMAGVLAHEIGHVTARHTAQRYSQAVAGNVGTAILGIFVGGELAQVGQQATGMFLQSYSREQEFEADKLGVRYLSRAGYETGSMASFLSSLNAYSALEAKVTGQPDPASRYNIMSTHPRTADRVVAATQAAQEKPVANARIGNIDYLRHVDGIVFGDSPEAGFVRGRVFAHKQLGFRFEVPEDFTLINSPAQVAARGPGDALIIFDGAAPYNGKMTAYLTSVWAAKANLTNVETLNVNGMEAATGQTRIMRNGASTTARLVAIRFDANHIFRFVFLTPTASTNQLSEPLRRTTFSFRRLSDTERAALKPWRIDTQVTQRGDTVATLARRLPLPGPKEEWFRVLNGLQPGSQPFPGQTVKMVDE